MDPNETLRLIEVELDTLVGVGSITKIVEILGTLDEMCADLYNWIDKGGFEPRWSKRKDATVYYRYWDKRV